MSEDHFQVLPQHKKMIINLLKSLYKIDISDDYIDEAQREEPFVNFNYRQAEFLRRTIVLRKICYPILKSREPEASKEIQNCFQFSLMNNNLNQAGGCFIHGLYLASIILCRSSLEIGLREAIAYVESSQNKTTFVREYNKLEEKTLRDLIPKAQEIHLIKEGEIDSFFAIPPEMKFDFKPVKLLDKFIHGAYSDLFVLVQNITIEGKGKSRNFEDFIKKLYEQEKEMHMGEHFTRSIYAKMILREELSLFFVYALFEIAELIFFDRLPKILSLEDLRRI
jgi:hypothetical protein